MVKGKTVLGNIIERLETAKYIDSIIVATSEERTDDAIAAYCEDNHINVFRGSLNNVAERFKSCAELYKLDYAMRINGDNIFIDIETVDFLARNAKEESLDFVSNVPGRTFPYGMSIEIVKTSFYERVYNSFESEAHYEHVTKYIYDNAIPQSSYLHKNKKYPELKSMQMAVDTQEDLDRAKFVADELSDFPKSYSLEDISSAIKKYANE